MIKVIQNIKENINYLFVLPLIVGFFYLQYIPLIIGLLIAVILAIKFGEKVLVVFTIITFLTLTTSLDSALRNIILVLNLLTLLLLFLKNYGLDFKNYIKPPKEVIILIISLLLIMFLTTICSKYMSIGIPHILRTISFFVFIYLYFALLSKYKDLYLLLISFILIGLFLAGMLVNQFLMHGFSVFLVDEDYLLNLKNFYVHKNTMGAFFTISIMFSIMTYYQYKERLIKYLAFLVMCFFIVGLIISNSRSSIVSLLIGIAFLLYYFNKKIIAYGVISLLSLIPLLFIEKINTLLSLYLRIDSLAAGRDKIFDAVFSALPHIWFLGAGPGAASYYMFDYYPFLMGSPEQLYWEYYVAKSEYGHAHNFYLFYFTDMGILGFIFAVYFQYTFIKIGLKCINTAKNVHNTNYYYMSICLLSIGITYFVRGFFEWGGILSYGFISIDLPFWLIFSLLAYIYQQLIPNNTEKI